MIAKHKRGAVETISNINIDIPPVGYAYDYRECKWVEIGVYTRSNKKDEQYWERIKPPFDYDKERRKELVKQSNNENFVDPKLEAFRNSMWQKRELGVWFMNNGEPVYITGQHFFYLNFWAIPEGYPKYRKADRDYFLFWHYIEHDEDSFGMIEATRRRAGKSVRAACIAYERASREYEHHVGIQSKTSIDAKKFYNKLLKSFKRLPDYFIPEYDTDGVKSGLYFSKTYRKGQKLQEMGNDQLDGDITFESSNNLAYDGQKLQTYIRDEAGKVDAANPANNVYEGWEIAKPTLMEGSKDIIGKAIYTSTVEEGGSEPFQKLWEESDPLKRNENNRTDSGMYSFFIPSYENDSAFIDKYGNCNIDASMEYQRIEREAKKKDPRKYASYVRKYPWKIEEAFYRDADSSPYDVKTLNETLETLTWLHKDNPLYYRGDLLWNEGIQDTFVTFVENPRGKFLINKIIDPFDSSKWNAVDIGYRPRALNATSILAGVDPFDHKAVDIGHTSRMSKGAGYVYHKHDGLDPEISEAWLCEYIERPADPNTFFEDMIKMCFFFGCEILVERNRSGLNNYFDDRGYSHWLKKEKGKKERGVSAGTENKEHASEVTSSWILRNGANLKKVPFPRLVRDWLEFDIQNSKKNDAAMAAGWALYGAERVDRAVVRKNAREYPTPKGNANKILGKL